jgi:pyridoxine kinase
VKITDMRTLTDAITVLHSTYRVPHIMITSVSFPMPGAAPSLFVLGSTRTSTFKPRIFKVQVPALDCFFSGTGDMLAALMLVRLREAVCNHPGLSQKDAWVSDDDIAPCELPLARAAEKALASMQEVLTRTKEKRDEEIARLKAAAERQDLEHHDPEKSFYLKATRAAEVRIVRNMDCVRNPELKSLAENVA